MLAREAKIRVEDPGGFYPDPSFEKINRIWIRSSISNRIRIRPSSKKPEPDKTLEKPEPDPHPALYLPYKIDIFLVAFDIKVNIIDFSLLHYR